MGETNTEYGADQIQILEGLEAVRKRPGMYIGSTSSRGLHHLVYEIVDNAVDEALAGYCTEINVAINPDNSITVVDNGRGIPVGINHKAGIPAVEVVFTILHAGGKFGGGGYKVSGGLHGVGASVVNALSEWLEVSICRDGKRYEQRYERGKTMYPLKEVGECGDSTGTTVTFLPDKQIFEETVYDYDILKQRLREMAFLTKGLKIILTDKREGMEREKTFLCFALTGAGITGYTERTSRGPAAGRPFLSGSSGEVSPAPGHPLGMRPWERGGFCGMEKTAAYFVGRLGSGPWSGGVRVVCLFAGRAGPAGRTDGGGSAAQGISGPDL